MNYKETIKDIVNKYIKREGIQELMSMLENGDFYTAPASTRFHDSCKEGLIIHSIKVYNELVKENKLLKNPYPDETIAIVALFHDLCKTNYYVVSSRNVKDEHGKWTSVPYYTVDDKFPYGHGEKSVLLITECMKLLPDEMFAIRWHMGGFEPKENYSALSSAYNNCPLAVLLHVADLKATYI